MPPTAPALPAFVALILRSNPPGSPFWDSRQLPSIYQGTIVRESEPRMPRSAKFEFGPHFASGTHELTISSWYTGGMSYPDFLSTWVQRDVFSARLAERMQDFPVLLCPVGSVPSPGSLPTTETSMGL